VSHLVQTVRFQEILRKLAVIDEGFVEDHAGFGLRIPRLRRCCGQGRAWPPRRRGVPGMEYRAAGAAEDEIANALLAIGPVAGLSRVDAVAPDVATALGYDITAALEEPDGHRCSAAGHVGVPADRRMSNPARWG
jgi:hypothetical protein